MASVDLTFPTLWPSFEQSYQKGNLILFPCSRDGQLVPLPRGHTLPFPSNSLPAPIQFPDPSAIISYLEPGSWHLAPSIDVNV